MTLSVLDHGGTERYEPPHQGRFGMTLVELLVIVAIVAILFGTLMPALQMAREASRRSSCANKVRQMMIGFTTYADAQKSLPGWRNKVEPFSTIVAETEPKEAAVSWTVPILPFIEEGELHGWYTNFKKGDDQNAETTKGKVKIFICPSLGKVEKDAPLSYAVNAGTGAEVLTEEEDPAQQSAGDGVILDAVGNLESDSLHDPSRPEYAPGKSDMKSIAADGTAMTILLTERCGVNAPQDISWAAHPRPPREHRGALKENHAILHPLKVGSGWRTEVQVINPTEDRHPLPSPVPANADVEDWNLRYPSSFHPGAVNVGFCDGHVRVIRDGIDVWVYSQLLSSNSSNISDGVKDWQQYFDDGGALVPYILNPDDLVR